MQTFGVNFTARFSRAENAFYKWVVFIEDYEALRAATKPLQNEIKAETEELRRNVKVLEMLENSVVDMSRSNDQTENRSTTQPAVITAVNEQEMTGSKKRYVSPYSRTVTSSAMKKSKM